MHVQARHPLGAFTLDAAFTAPERGVTALFGPSGSGKTSLLRCVAGLLRPREGRVEMGGAIWQDSAGGVFLPPHRRQVGYVFQEASLFPHLSVRGNLRYAQRRAQAASAGPTLEGVTEWLGLAALIDRMPGKLSGGERQRVAIARALLANPAVLLLDEPLSALDEASRQEVLHYLEQMHAALQVPVLYVSHLVKEVARLADTIVLMQEGRVAQTGPAEELLRELLPRDAGEQAAFALVEAEVVCHDTQYALSEGRCGFGTVWLPGTRHAPGAKVWLQIFAREVSLALAEEHASSILNQWRCVVSEISAAGAGQLLVRLAPLAGGAEHLFASVTRKSGERLGLALGQPVLARVKSVSMVE